MKLNIGCGNKILDGYINIDKHWNYNPGVINWDFKGNLKVLLLHHVMNSSTSVLEYKKDIEISEILLDHVLEHLEDPLQFMGDLYTIVEPNCSCTITVPYGSSSLAWEDLTHKRAYFENSFNYLAQPTYTQSNYGYLGDWQPITIKLKVNSEFEEILRKLHDLPDDFSCNDENIIALSKVYRNVFIEMKCELMAIKPARFNSVKYVNPQILIER